MESVVEAEVTLLQSLQIYLQRKFRHEQNPGATLLCFFPEAEKIHFLFTHPYAFLALMNRPERPTTEARNWHLKALPLRKQPPLPRTCSQVTPWKGGTLSFRRATSTWQRVLCPQRRVLCTCRSCIATGASPSYTAMCVRRSPWQARLSLELGPH